MIEITIRNYLEVKNLPKEIFKVVVGRLTYPNPEYLNALKHSKNQWAVSKMPQTIRSYKQKRGLLLLPRGYYLELRLLLEDQNLSYEIYDETPKLEKIHSQQRIDLFPHQLELIKDIESDWGYNCIVQSPPGSGKTYLGMEYARKLGYKTLWIAYRDFLFDQAISSAIVVFGIPEEEIGIIKGPSLTIGKQITIASLKTLTNRELENLGLTDIFGLIIIDEGHHAPAKSWQKEIYRFNCKKVLALTATPRRNDGLTPLLLDCVGPIVGKADPELLIAGNFICRVSYQYMETGISVEGMTFRDIETKLIKSKERNTKLIQLIDKEFNEDQNNYIVMLSARRAHVEEMHSKCLDYKIPSLMLMGGQTSKKEKARIQQELDSKRCRVLIATYSYITEGFDYPPLNRVIFATPFRDTVRLEQAIGRAQRVHQNKNLSKVIDLVDDNGLLENQLSDRLFHAESLDLQIEKYIY